MLLFWRAFLSSTLVAFAGPISCGAFLGDWSGYVPRDTNKIAMMAASTAAQILCLVPFLFGLMTASIIVLALLSGMSVGTTSLYGTVLDFSSVFPKLSRAPGGNAGSRLLLDKPIAEEFVDACRLGGLEWMGVWRKFL